MNKTYYLTVIATSLCMAPMAHASEDAIVFQEAEGQVNMDAVESYWTPERMQSAVPRSPATEILDENEVQAESLVEPPLPGPPAVMPGWSPDSAAPPPGPGDLIELNSMDDWPSIAPNQFTTFGSAPSNPKDGPYPPFQRWTMHGKYQVWPRFIHGKLFFSEGGRNFVCSASVVNRSVLITAGHCVSDGDGSFATNFLFCPGYSQSGPMAGVGCWSGFAATVSRYFNDGELDYDYGCLITNSSGTVRNQPVGNVTGWAGWAVNWPTFQPTLAFGYPAGSPFQGNTIQQVASTEWYVSDRSPGSQLSKYIGSDMTGGSSGGGWFLSWRHPSVEIPDTDANAGTDPAGAQNGPYINGLNSHKRCRTNCNTPPTSTAGVFWQEMGSPQFLNGSDPQDFKSLYDACVDFQP